MKILIIADEESASLWDYWSPAKTKDIDMIVSCGDLKKEYLEFLVTMTNKPLLYVRGNHDEAFRHDPPEGCLCIDGEITEVNGLVIAGLGGSRRYHEGEDMYTEKEMNRRITRLFRRNRRTDRIDILVTHAPTRHYGDLEDIPHQGFECFERVLERFHPRYQFYGHIHASYGSIKREMEHPSGCRFINGSGAYTIEV